MTEAPNWPWVWGATAAEVLADYPCAEVPIRGRRSVWRAVNVSAPAEVTNAWMCQLKRAPYSYDLIDNWGRRSPRSIDESAVPMRVGDQVMIFECTQASELEWTGTVLPRAEKVFGMLSTTYRVTPHGAAASRLVCRLDFSSTGRGFLARALGVGDLVMMRKQLLTLKHLAEVS